MTSNETPCPTVTQSEEIGVQRLARTESEQEEGMGEMEEREPEMELQVEYEIYESNISTYQP